MKKMMWLMAIFTLMTGCTAEFREPICKESEKGVPSALEGTYSMTIPRPGSISNDPFKFEESFIKIEANKFYVTSALMNSAKLKTNFKPSPVQGGVPDVCTINGRYYLEMTTERDTTVLYEIVPEAQGLSLLTQTLDTDILNDNSIPYFILPNFVEVSSDGEFAFGDMSQKTILIVDNRNVNRDQLLSLTRVPPFSYHFKKVSEPKVNFQVLK